MKKLFLILILMGSLFNQLSACEVVQKLIKSIDFDEAMLVPFLKTNDGEDVPLPTHLAYGSIESNKEKTIWGINFHAVSNYEGVDLVLCNQGNPIIAADIFQQLENQLVSKKIIPKYSWGNQILRIQKIERNMLVCFFYGVDFTQQLSVDKTFKVLVKTTSNKVVFKVLAK